MMSGPARVPGGWFPVDNSELRLVDLFCGAGGLSLGFQAAGFRIAAALDNDEKCAATYQENFSRLQPNFPPLVLGGSEKGDASKIDLESLGRQLEPDVLIGGPPCRGFSKIGRAKLNSLSVEGYQGDPRNELYRRFLEAARLWQPMFPVSKSRTDCESLDLVVDGRRRGADFEIQLPRKNSRATPRSRRL